VINKKKEGVINFIDWVSKEHELRLVAREIANKFLSFDIDTKSDLSR